MAVTTLSGYRAGMVARLPDCPVNLLNQALQLGSREFCQDTEAFRQELTAMDLVADQKEYTLSAPAGYEISRVFEVRLLTEDEVTDGDEGTVQSTNKYEYDIQTGTLTFYSAPSTEAVTGGLVIEVVLLPLEDGAVLDAEFMRRWGRTIQDWAYWWLFSMDGKPWASETQAAAFFNRYRRGVVTSRVDGARLYTSRELRMQAAGFLER